MSSRIIRIIYCDSPNCTESISSLDINLTEPDLQGMRLIICKEYGWNAHPAMDACPSCSEGNEDDAN